MKNLKIQILGSGCTKCKKLFSLTQQAVTETQIDATVNYTDDIAKMVATGAMSSPVITVNGKIIISGTLPSLEELKKLLLENIVKNSTEKSIGFVGGGRITKIMLSGWQRAGVMPKNIIVNDLNDDVLQNLKKQFPEIHTEKNNTKALQQDLVFIALHPPVIKEVIENAKTILKPETILISLAPKITIKQLNELLGNTYQIARVIPNAPSIINKGYNPISLSSNFTEENKNTVLDLLKNLGKSPIVKEEKLEGYAISAAMGPTYFMFMFLKLKELNCSMKLNKTEVNESLKEMITGTTELLFTSEISDEEALDLIPVKPLAEHEKNISDIFEQKIMSIYQKITN